ncbi:hypothetical protein [Brevibacillus brevis]|uniref:hypothetical protein n=1 Tax=Brevibacillus brevis TaxID=1393 RepID=UPI0037BFF29A
MIAPFGPLLAEDLYGNLTGDMSVHLRNHPQPNPDAIDKQLELVSLYRSSKKPRERSVHEVFAFTSSRNCSSVKDSSRSKDR